MSMAAGTPRLVGESGAGVQPDSGIRVPSSDVGAGEGLPRPGVPHQHQPNPGGRP